MENVELLEADLRALKAGQRSRIRPLSNQLRLLVASGDGNRLLQRCAMTMHAELPVFQRFTSNGRTFLDDMPSSISNFALRETISGVPTPSLRCETDLDHWLELPFGVFDGDPVNNEEMLLGISNKIGSHSDTHNRQNYEMLSGIRDGKDDHAHSFIVQLADVVLKLASELLEQHSKMH
jgi:hypothetical protein